MPRSRPASSPLSYHKQTKQYYVTRGGRRIYFGSDHATALERYHRFEAKLPALEPAPSAVSPTAKELANRFIAAQQANWRSPERTLKGYRDWLGRFLTDHPGLRTDELTVERFVAWKLSLRERGYAPESINHYLSAVRAMYRFAEDAGLMERAPRLRRVKNESREKTGSHAKLLYTPDQIARLLATADVQLRAMILLGLNCGFGPKDLEDLLWTHLEGRRVSLPRSKTGVSQTFLLWPETLDAFEAVSRHRAALVVRLERRGRERTDGGHIFATKFWRPWTKDAVAEQVRKLCRKAGVPCYGFYRLRHCASTTMSLVATPHVHRRFMRHTQLQQQVTYTHTPDAEVDAAVVKARAELLGAATANAGIDPARACEPEFSDVGSLVAGASDATETHPVPVG